MPGLVAWFQVICVLERNFHAPLASHSEIEVMKPALAVQVLDSLKTKHRLINYSASLIERILFSTDEIEEH